jgi:hypothetical protein
MITHDVAAPILRAVPNMSDELRGDLWDLFHDSKTAEELAQKLSTVPIADSLKRQLILARAKSLQPEPSDSTSPITDAAIDAMHRVSQLPQHVRSIAERHPLIAKFLVDINTKS